MALGIAKQDSGGHFLAGPFDPSTKNGRAWRGANDDGDLIDGCVVLYDASGNPLFLAVDMDSGAGSALRAAIGLLVPASGGPAVVPGDATNGLKVQQTTGVLPSGGTPTAAAATLFTTAAGSVSSGSSIPCKTVLIQNPSTNAVAIKVGDSVNQTIRLEPGAAIVLPVSNVNLLYAANVSSATQVINWLSIN